MWWVNHNITALLNTFVNHLSLSFYELLHHLLGFNQFHLFPTQNNNSSQAYLFRILFFLSFSFTFTISSQLILNVNSSSFHHILPKITKAYKYVLCKFRLLNRNNFDVRIFEHVQNFMYFKGLRVQKIKSSSPQGLKSSSSSSQ